jgi:predicted metal-dependent enzyme (double-stranded beta helix superfamily)
MRLFPHDHRMWAAIGIYGGTEDNEFFRRGSGGLESSGGKSIEQGEVLLLGDDAIHAVANPLSSFTGAIHVYGGDFFAEPRSEWDPDTGEERPFDVDHVREVFADANERAQRQSYR